MKHLRIGLFLFDCIDPLRLQETVARIAAEVASEIEEIVIVDDRLQADSALLAIPEVRGLRAPRDLGYGGARKAAFEYASARGFDHVIALYGDGSHPPELIGSFLAAIERSPHALIVATRQ
jgi:glycosyltransferase involved in cell wall biosynthesis